MNRLKHLYVFIFTSFLVLACTDTAESLTPLKKNSTILAFGDSLTYGSGVKQHESYPSVLSRLLSMNVINAGVPGEKTKAGLARLPSLIKTYQPKLLILIHGGNDMLRKNSRAQMKKNLQQMISYAKQKNIDVIIAGVPKPGLMLSDHDVYQELANEYKIPYLRSTISSILSDRALKSDPIHPNALGYKKLAEDIYDVMRKHGAV